MTRILKWRTLQGHGIGKMGRRPGLYLFLIFLIPAVLILMSGWLLSAPGVSASAQISSVTVGRYQTLELVFAASETPANPFDTYLLKLEITDPSGNAAIIDGFYDGDGSGGQTGNIWKARISPDQLGMWTWTAVPGDQVDNALVGLSGQFEVIASGEPGGIVQDGQQFRFQNGEHLFLVGNFLDFTDGLPSTHVYMSEALTDAERSAIMLRQRNFHLSNKANIYFANRNDYSFQPVTPWVGSFDNNDKTTMDLQRWLLYDGYIQSFKENQMLAELWFFADESSFGGLSTEDRNRLLRYGMARTSAFNHTMYVIALEWQEGFTQAQISQMGSFLEAHNPWGRALSVHNLNQREWEFGDDTWPSFIASQVGNGANPHLVNDYAITVGISETLPHLSEEFGHLVADESTRMRGNLWANLCGGAAGGGTGSGLAALQRFIAQSGIPFQRMAPANELVTLGGSDRYVLAESDHHYLVYSETGAFDLDVSGSNLLGYWFDPRDPLANLGPSFPVPAGTQTFTPPSMVDSDWVLWVTDASNLNSGVTHPTDDATVTVINVNPGPTATPGATATLPPDPTETPPPAPTNTATNTPLPAPTNTATNTPSPAPTNTPTAGVATATPVSPNLALDQPVTVSSVARAYLEGAYAVDGDNGTSWQTAVNSGLAAEWIVVDLGAPTPVSQIVLEWDIYYPTNYTLDVSLDGIGWMTVYSDTAGNGGIDDVTIGIATARYVRMNSTAWTNGSRRIKLNELAVYGSGAAPTATPTPFGPTPTPDLLAKVHVGDLDGTATSFANRWQAFVTVHLHDPAEQPVEGATVLGTWSGGASGSTGCTTGTNGSCTIYSPYIRWVQTSITLTLDSVDHPGLDYDAAANHDPDADSDGTVIVINSP